MRSRFLRSGVVCMVLGVAQARAQGSAGDMPDGWSALFLNNVTVQKSTQDALRSRPSPFRPDLVTDHGARLLNLLALQFKRDDWTLIGVYSDNRTLGGGSAYSLTNPMAFGVNTVEAVGGARRSVDFKSGLQEVAARYRRDGTMVMVGKIDTANWYLADPLFAGDLITANDYGNAATRVVAPPFPSMAVVVRQDLGNGYSVTGIAGDAFGDRETLDAGRNLVRGDLAYVLELNFQDRKQHYQLTLNHVDAFRFFDKDAVWPGPGEKAPRVDAMIATASHRLSGDWAAFGRVGFSRGDAQIETANYLVGMRYDLGGFYALASQSATSVGSDNTPYKRGAKGDVTYVTEFTLNYKVHPRMIVGITYDRYSSSGDSLLAKDGGWNGARRNQVVGVRVTSFLPL